MTATAGFYSIIQFVPHAMRQEGVNVGVIVLVPGKGVHFRFASRNEQVKRRVGVDGYDEKLLDAEKRGMGRRIAEIAPTVAALAHLAATEAGSLRILPAMPARIIEVESTVDRLFGMLVDDPPRAKRDRHRGPDIRRYFEQLSNLHVAIRAHVEVHVGPTGEKFVADYAYKNGVHNLIKSSGFGPTRTSALKHAEDLGAKGILLQNSRIGDDSCHLIVVGDAPSTTTEQVTNVLRLYDVDYYSMKSIDSLVTRVQQEAHE